MTKVKMLEPFMYGIIGPDGSPYFGEFCVSGRRGDLAAEVGGLNDHSGEGPYREVGLITTDQAEAYAAAKVREALEWQPIETAPKDGTRVILAWAGKSINGFFLDNSRSSRPWAGWRTESMAPTPIGQPTHWMPLPPPPQHDNE